jgi:uncharacterized membrane-anchored protein
MRHLFNILRAFAALILLGFMSLSQAADTPASPAPHGNDREAAIASALQAMQAAQVKGPSDIQLKDQAVLKLPAGYIWVPEPAAGQFMKAVGNHPDARELGLIFPQSEQESWMIVATYENAGYIKDDDARHWDVDAMFKSLQEGTASANEERRAQGFPELEILGWVEKPTYAADAHQLIWSMSAREKGAPANVPTSINYNTYALGRDGFISFNLITNLQTIEQEKRHARVMLSSLQFHDGKRYADYNASTDRTAEYGLAALVGGLAAKKLGLFALAAGFFAKFAKVIVLATSGVAAAARKIFGKKQA